ncbi:MAG TPA: magnesium transporter CorA family protein [Caulobacteraceae bacterium]|nr:magnesium transporter CorA family protein [Caulobacteraceae bacterium]
MLRILKRGASEPEQVQVTPGWALPEDAVWVDLLKPTREEELAVESAIGVQIPTREEMAEIETSSRLYQERGATFMTAAVLTHATTDFPLLAPVTFVLAGDRLVTVRYDEPSAFAAFISQFERQPCGFVGGEAFLELLDAIVDRVADILEAVAAEVEEASHDIFRQPRKGGFGPVLAQLGHAQMVTGKARASLASLARLISFASLARQLESVRGLREHLRSLQRDTQSLTDHTAYLSSNITFLLDAAMGMINIEQNAIIKIFSVAAVAFLPPTLIASIYGMNFEFMPELDWPFGYPFALLLMVLSAVIPLAWFRRKGWL